MLAFLCCVLASHTAAFQACAAAGTPAPKSAPAATTAELPPLAADMLARSTPYGTVLGFLRAVDKGDYELASHYLDGNQSAKIKAQLAHDLKTVLNRGLKIGLEDLSRVPEGRLDDGLNVYLEKVGTATYGDGESLDIVLRRTTRSDTPPVWLFSAETLLGVAAAAEQLELAWGEALWSEPFREIRFLAYPLYLLINLLVSVPVMLLVTWLLTRWLLAALGPVFARQGELYGKNALSQIKWLVFLLVFSLLLRLVSAVAVTVTSRIFFASFADMLITVSITMLLVRITTLVTRLKILRLKQAGRPSSIAAVELFSWLVMGVWIIAGLFLILRSLGFEVTAAVAGLGVGGIAIAFAAQKTIENLFGTVTIVTDKAIHVGDYCQAGSTEGGVESIGLRSTRIRTPDRALVSIPNGQLASMTIGNLSYRDKFLFRHNIRLRYETSARQLRSILEKTREMLAAHPRLEPSTLRTRLVKFGDYSLDLEVFAYVLTREATTFLEVQEDLLLRIMDIVESSGTSVAASYETASATRKLAAGGKPIDAPAARGRPASRELAEKQDR